jgi:hypothetical protein
MGLIKEVHKTWREPLHFNPAFSIEESRKVLPYKNAGVCGQIGKPCKEHNISKRADVAGKTLPANAASLIVSP